MAGPIMDRSNSGKEMKGSSLSPRDRVLWLLANHGGKMVRSRLRRCMGVRYAFLNPILEELAREGKIWTEGEMYR